MVFSSLSFLCIFLPAVFLLSLLVPGIRAKNYLLLCFSVLFYAYGEPVYVFLLFASALLNYLFGRWIGENRRKSVLFLAVLSNLLILIVFKYAGLLTECINGLFRTSVPVPQIRLPIGISFFTFQAMSYVIDVYREEAAAQKNFSKVFLYLALFPQLIAGPIVKYHDIAQEIDDRTQTMEDIAKGLRRFLAGLSKKVLISNTLALTADAVFGAGSGELNVLGAWIGAVSYMLQIYFDFSGYSDMAIGMGWMFGFHFKENFRYPYCADSIQDFWRRWHISLSGWFRDYLYIPLGGNRKGEMRAMLNRFVVFLCTGIWHGANVTFVFWGVFHGFFITMEALLRKHTAGTKEKNGLWRRIAAHSYALLVVCVGFVFFRSETLAEGFLIVREMFTGFHFEPQAVSFTMRQLHPLFLTGLAAAVAASVPVKEKLLKLPFYEGLAAAGSIAGLILCILSLAGNSYNPFIYFQF